VKKGVNDIDINWLFDIYG